MRCAVVLSIALPFVGCAVPAATHAAGLCRAGETTYFSCTTARHKTISLCGRLPGTVQYRYGTPGKVELAHPADPARGARGLGYAHYMRYRTERSEVTFRRGGVDYALFDYADGGGLRAGVHVTNADGTEHEIACAGKVEGHLNSLGKSLHCDQDSALNGGRCP